MPCANGLYLKPVTNLSLTSEMLETFPLTRSYQDAHSYLLQCSEEKRNQKRGLGIVFEKKKNYSQNYLPRKPKRINWKVIRAKRKVH